MVKPNIDERANRMRVEGRLIRTYAEVFVEAGAYWFHPTGKWVHAPKHAKRIYENASGWEIDFGANTFRVEVAFNRSVTAVKNLAPNLRPENDEYLELKTAVGIQIRGAVANYEGREYPGFYHAGMNMMKIGTQAIWVDAMTEAIQTQLLLFKQDT